jgi:diguanylate cyclase (GGDEF)-like protein
MIRKWVQRWIEFTTPPHLPIATIDEREHARKLQLNSRIILIVLFVTCIYFCINFWPIDFGSFISGVYLLIIFLAAWINKQGRLMISNAFIVFGALGVLAFDMAFVLKITIGLFWVWSIFVLLPMISAMLLFRWLPAVTGGCAIVAMAIITVLRQNDFFNYAHGYTFVLFISYVVTILLAITGFSMFYSQSVRHAIQEADRAFELEHLHRELQLAYTQLDKLANMDQVTGLTMRRRFHEIIDEAFAQKRYPLSIIFSDIDHFKQINDTFGHRAGDTALKYVATSFQEIVSTYSQYDITIARFGGEEFIIFIIGMDHEEAIGLAEELRRFMELNVCCLESETISLTCSFGIATAPQHANTPNQLIEIADQTMYLAKRSGRNCVRTPFIREVA